LVDGGGKCLTRAELASKEDVLCRKIERENAGELDETATAIWIHNILVCTEFLALSDFAYLIG